MKTLIAGMLMLVAFAGCVDSDPAADLGNEVPELFIESGLNGSHPQYNFGISSALFDSPDGSLFMDHGDVRQWFNTPYVGAPGQIGIIAPLAQVSDAGSAGGIAVFGGMAFVGNRGASGPLNIVNILDPANPEIIASIADVPVRDADTILYPDGRLFVISTAGGGTMFSTNVTNPYNGTAGSVIDTPSSNHNIAVVPGTPIAYNSGRDIVDWTNPVNPILVGKAPGSGSCHDIAFHIDRTSETYWALCAGYANTEIWDITNATAPVMHAVIAYPSIEKGAPIVGGDVDDQGVPQDAADAADPACQAATQADCPVSAAHPSSFSHLAIVNHDATVLIMGDETGGGASNQCDFYYEGPDGEVVSGPIGNLWFYDITDPQKPDLHGHVSPGYADAEGSCTAHFGKVIGDTDYLVMAFYTAGVTLIEFGDLDNPRIVQRYDNGGDVWDVQFHQGFLVTGDITRGMDLLRTN